MAEATPKESWDANANTISGNLSIDVAKYDSDTSQYTRLLGINHKGPFTLTPIKISNGEFQGKYALVLTPVFRFMDLPPEIRSLVYSYLFEEEAPINISIWRPYGERIVVRADILAKIQGRQYQEHEGEIIRGIEQKTTGILSVSKQLHREAAPVLYGNSFSFPDTRALGEFLRVIRGMVKLVKHISITHSKRLHHSDRFLFHRIRWATSLRTINLDHDKLCFGWDKSDTSLERFVKYITSSLISLQNRHQEDNTSISIPQMFEVTLDWYRREPKSESYRGCDNTEGHCEEVTARLRSLLEKALQNGTKKVVE